MPYQQLYFLQLGPQTATTPSVGKSIIVGLRLLELPDFLAAMPVMHERAQIDMLLQRWSAAVAHLWQWQNAAFALRFLSDPARNTMEIALLIRVHDSSGQAQAIGVNIAQNVAHLLAQFQIRVTPITDAQTFRRFHTPFARTYLREIRQGDAAIPLRALGDSFYTVYHFWQPGGDWFFPFELGIQQPAPSLISIHLEPTTLTDAERNVLSQKASLGQQLGQGRVEGTYYSSGRVPPDSQAALAGSIFARNVQRLQQPFLLAIQIASPSEHAAGLVARTLGTTIVEESRLIDEQGRTLPSSYAIFTTDGLDATAQRAAACTLFELALTDWGPTIAPSGQERLRFLADARGAAAAFRFPITSAKTAHSGRAITGINTIAVERTRLVSVLADLYPLTEDSYRLVDAADIPRTHVAFSAKGIDTWNAILNEAIRRNKLLKLVRIALADYPDERLLRVEQALARAEY